MINTLSNNTIEGVYSSRSWEVGDSKQPTFYPQFKTLHWDNDANFSARLVAPTNSILPTITGDMIEWDDGNVVARFYEEVSSDGAFEVEVQFNAIPSTNIITYSLQTKNLDLFYQPELTADEVAAGYSRPDNVVGSYAAYHSSKRDNEYKAGKAFHIYRPSAKDASGVEVWCDLRIDGALTTLTITIPQGFLDSATYPVTVDPTFGYATAGASSSTILSNEIARIGSTNTYVASTGDTITSFSVYGSSSVGTPINFATYSFNGTVPVNRLAAETSITLSSVGAQWWNSSTVSQVMTGGTTYVVAVGTQGTGGLGLNTSYDSGSGTQRTADTAGGGHMPATWASSSTSGAMYSMYATYTAGSSGVSVATTGTTGTFTAGSVAAKMDSPLVGATGNFTAGTISSSRSPQLSGVSATFSPGTVTPSTATLVALTGVSGTFSPGTLSATQIALLSGASGTFFAGTVSPTSATFVALVGVTGTFSLGTLSTIQVSTLSGTSATFSLGIVSPHAGSSPALTGTSATWSLGLLTPVIVSKLSGVSSSFSSGILTPRIDIVRALTGVSATLTARTLKALSALPLSGVSSFFSLGTVLPPVPLILTGAVATFSLGTLTPVTSLGPIVALSLNFNTADRIIRVAMRNAHLLQKGEDPDSEDYADYLLRLDDMVNMWQTQGIKLWLNVLQTIPLVAGVANYALGPGGLITAAKPMRILEGYYFTPQGVSRPLDPLSWNTYGNLSTKAQQGAITGYFVDKQVNNLVVSFWLTPDATAALGVVKLLTQVSVGNSINLTDTVNFPIEWFLALQWGLADEMATGQPQQIADTCRSKALLYRQALEDWDVEDAPITFSPNRSAEFSGPHFR